MLPACYEGIVESNCCLDFFSDASTSKWGVNAWQPLYVNVRPDFDNRLYYITVTSLYPNPYPTLISGTFYGYNFLTSGSTVSYSSTYPAGVTSYTYTMYNTGPYGVVSNVLVTSIAPIFDNGGTLQQRDTVNTPQYFGFYNTSGCTSGSTTSGCTAPVWNGSPILLPSFTLDGFNVTAVDTSSNPIAGNLLISWIQSATFGGGAGIYHSITFQIYDSTGTTLQGTVTVPYGVAGLNNTSIHMISTVGTIAITTQYQMRTLWADTSISATQQFYLPTF